MIQSRDLIGVVQQLSLCRTADDVMGVLRTSVRTLIGADGVTVVLRDGDLCHYADEDAIAPLWKGRRFPMQTCISGWAMLNRQQVAIEDIYADARIPHDAYRPTFVKSLAMTPIRQADPMGAIGVYWARGHAATEMELAALQAIGDSAAIAFANVQLLGSLTAANRYRDDFLLMLAHELRNPLGPIRSAAHLLSMISGTHEAARKATETIDRQMDHLGRILDDLLDAGRLVKGDLRVQRARLDLNALLRRVADDHAASLAAAGIRFSAMLPDRHVWISGDDTRLTQVFGSMLDNARKFAGAGARVTLTLATDAAGYATVSVSDTGRGIEPSQLGRIFETFAQSDRSLDRSAGGLGLGLSIAKSLIGLHGGTIVADSAGPGRGAEFTVRVPAEKELSPVTAMPLEPAHAGRGRVLVVEDNYDAADMLRAVLEVNGFDVSVAHTGPDGIETAKSERPGNVVCDIGLPGADGYTVAAEIRAFPPTAASRLIAVTGYGSDDDRRRALDAGFDVHLVKPVPPPVLLRHLATA